MLNARLERGMWLVDCPDPHGVNCKSALAVKWVGNEDYWLNAFVCLTCGAGAGVAILPDMIPPLVASLREPIQRAINAMAIPTVELGSAYAYRLPDDWRKIELAVGARPQENKNWIQGETLEDLMAENKKNGVS